MGILGEMSRCLLLLVVCFASLEAAERPNILWISSEDNGPHLGFYGDTYANTPNLDAVGRRGLRYLNAWSTAPVCAPARTTIISGMYPPSTGSQHMRSLTQLPESMQMFPQYLREAGYYVSNNAKEDYNLVKPGQVWDESNRNAHWRNRPEGQPFFAVFNFTITHESQIRMRPHGAVHDPAKVRVPAYHPDTPESRQDWAQYHDKMTEMDAMAGEILEQLREDDLEESTIIFYWGDHGPGMPRGKRWTYNSGLHVPMLLYVPEKFSQLRPRQYQPGGSSNRPVGFIDLAPTVLSLAGIKPPAHLQGHAFAGEFETPDPAYNFAFRGRMDERYDMVRSMRDERYIYIRNFKPHRIYGQYIQYMFQTPTTRVWHELYTKGLLSAPRTHFWETKPAVELYDLQDDPDETINLASQDEFKPMIERFEKAMREWLLGIRDLGFLPEYEIHQRSAGGAPYVMGHDDSRYPLERVMQMADIASSMRSDGIEKLRAGFEDEDSAVRYWAALGALMREQGGVDAMRGLLQEALEDPAPSVRIAAAEALGRYGNPAQTEASLTVLLELANAENHGVYLAMAALNAIDYMDRKASSILEEVKSLPQADPKIAAKFRSYLPNLIGKIQMDFE